MHWLSLGAISIISLYVLVLSVSPFIIGIGSTINSYLEIVVIASSIGILVLSLYDSGKEYMVKSERFVMCGRDLAKILRRLDLMIETRSVDSHNLKNVINEYNEVLDKYAENHEQYDFDYFRAKRSLTSDEFDIGACKYVLYIVSWNLRIYWKAFLFSIIPPILLVVLIAYFP